MKAIKQLGLIIFLTGLAIFTGTIFTGSFNLSSSEFDSFISEKGYKSEVIKEELKKAVITNENLNIFEFSSRVRSAYKTSNDHYDALIAKYDAEKNWDKKGEQYQYKIYGKPHSLSYTLAKKAGKGLAADSTGLMWFLTFGLGIFGALMFIVPDVVILGKPGIKNNGIFLNAATNRGWIGWFAFVFLVTFYILLYFYPDFIVNWVFLVDPISGSISGNPASQWFLYGFLYCTVMTVMAVRMYIKYRHNKYQILRTLV
jgi:ferredoxin-type protein NapH